MNERIKERIKELADQCYYVNTHTDLEEFDELKFAELIIRECAGICDERARSAPMGSEEQCEADDCAYSIKKYFGVLNNEL